VNTWKLINACGAHDGWRRATRRLPHPRRVEGHIHHTFTRQADKWFLVIPIQQADKQ
jgi:hypothetical protein